jgi:hypothetical protein
VFFLSNILLNSCYKPESFPNKYVSEYEFAVPLIDSVFSASDFESFKYEPDSYEVQKDFPVKMGVFSYSFSLNNSSGDAMQWIEPRIVLDTRNFIQNTKISFKIYITGEDENEKSYFWLPEDYSITTNRNMQTVETDNNRIFVETLKQSKRLWIDVTFYFAEDTPLSVLKSKELGFHLAVKCKTISALKI